MKDNFFIVIYEILCCLVIGYEPALHPSSFFLQMRCKFWRHKFILTCEAFTVKTVLWSQNLLPIRRKYELALAVIRRTPTVSHGR